MRDESDESLASQVIVKIEPIVVDVEDGDEEIKLES
jgi:hypothetical protein